MFQRAAHFGREMLSQTDSFFRHYGPAVRNVAQMVAPALAKANPALAAGVAAAGMAADNYSSLRNALGD